MYSSIHGLRFDTDSLYEFMRALASEQLNPMIIPPKYDYSFIFQNILQKVQNDIKTNARLKLPDDPVKNIWSYYGTTKLTPIILENYLMLILTVPLIDTSLQMNLYKVHNLPTVHPVLQVQANYELESKYFATLKHNMYMWHYLMKRMSICVLLLKDIYVYSIKFYIQLNKSNGVSMPLLFKTEPKLERIVRFPLNFNQLTWPIVLTDIFGS